MTVVIVLGSLASLVFHLVVTENHDGAGEEELAGHNITPPMTPRDWFLEPQFYQIAGVYMCSRLYVNLSQVYIPLYLQVRRLRKIVQHGYSFVLLNRNRCWYRQHMLR